MVDSLYGVLRAGSSPLTRGKRAGNTVDLQASGLIPAHAGKTLRSRRLEKLAAAHPRSRGENLRLVRWSVTVRGSSPLTRGKLATVSHRPQSTGLIPAHAGKTFLLCAYRRFAPAHPRSRGENTDPSACADGPPGSSPLTRGKRPRLQPQPHAGGAHPRSRGENPVQQGALGLAAGSSPLTRGKLAFASSLLPSIGLIPAHAGKTNG